MMNIPFVRLRKVLGDVYPITAISVQRKIDVKDPLVNVPDTGARWSSSAMTLTRRVGERR